MKTLRTFTTVCFAVAFLTVAARAADLSGNWKWTSQSSSGPVQMSATLLHKDGALTGTVTGRQGPAEIGEASIMGSVVAFTVIRGVAPNIVTFKYTGTIAGDTITGTILRSVDGTPPREVVWKAERAK